MPLGVSQQLIQGNPKGKPCAPVSQCHVTPIRFTVSAAPSHTESWVSSIREP